MPARTQPVVNAESGAVASEGTSEERRVRLEEARAALAEDKEARCRACATALEAALREHRCGLVARPRLEADGRLGAYLDLEAQE